MISRDYPPQQVKELLLVGAIVVDNAAGIDQRWKRSSSGCDNNEPPEAEDDDDLPPPLTPWKKPGVVPRKRRQARRKLSPPVSRWEATPEAKGKDKMSLSMMMPTPLRSCTSLVSASSASNRRPTANNTNTAPLRKPVRRGSADEEDDEITISIQRLMIDLDEEITDFDCKYEKSLSSSPESTTPTTTWLTKEASASPLRKPRRQKSKSINTVSILNEALLLMDDLAVVKSAAAMQSSAQ